MVDFLVKLFSGLLYWLTVLFACLFIMGVLACAAEKAEESNLPKIFKVFVVWALLIIMFLSGITAIVLTWNL